MPASPPDAGATAAPAPPPPKPAAVAAAYFAALGARDVEAMVACWAPGGREDIRGQVDTTAPDGVREYFTALFAAMPDLAFRVLATTVQRERAVVRWELHGTFAGTPFGGVEATGARLHLEGMDELTIRDGLITANNAFADSMTFARQIGMLPPAGSPADRRILRAFNATSRLAARLASGEAEAVADGVWRVRGGLPKRTMNVYLVEDDGGVLAFDAGIRQMVPGIATAAALLGGLTRVVLGHAHADHRGAAAGLGAPVLCHADDRADAEGDGDAHYFELGRLPAHGRLAFARLLRYWDGGPVPAAATLAEGDAVGGFEVVHLPGHAPGLIALWRGLDRLALTTGLLLHRRPADGRVRRAARAAGRLQPGHRAGAFLDPQAGGPGARLCLAGPRRAAARGRRRGARDRGGDDLVDAAASSGRNGRAYRRWLTWPAGAAQAGCLRQPAGRVRCGETPGDSRRTSGRAH